MIKSESIGKLTEALVAAQNEFQAILKKQVNSFFKKPDGSPSKYADLATVLDATQPALIKNNLAVLQFPVSETGKVGVLTILSHNSGEFIGEAYTLPTAKQDAQTGVAAITYARRASLQAVLGVAAEDDDGNTAAGRKTEHFETEAAEPLPTKTGRTVTVSPPNKPPQAEIPDKVYQATDEDLPQGLFDAPTPEIPKSGGAKPTDTEFTNFVSQIALLAEELKKVGLKARRGLPERNIIGNYIRKITGQDNAKLITSNQWTAFWQFVEKIKSTEGGATQLAQIIDKETK